MDTTQKSLYWEDLTQGQRFETSTHVITAEEITAFASQYDPQPMHLSEAAAAQTPFKRQVASGWHTLVLTMRLLVAAKPLGSTPLIGMGSDEVRIIKPVYPGQRLHASAEITHLRPSQSNPQRGHVHLRILTYADGTLVATQTWHMLMPRKPVQ